VCVWSIVHSFSDAFDGMCFEVGFYDYAAGTCSAYRGGGPQVLLRVVNCSLVSDAFGGVLVNSKFVRVCAWPVRHRGGDRRCA
jgi:hypothetical protein